MATIIVGYTVGVRSDAREDLLPMPPDGRLAKPSAKDSPEEFAAKEAKLAASVEQKWEKFEQETSKRCKLTADIKDIFAVDLDSGDVFDSTILKRKDTDVSVLFVAWLLDLVRDSDFMFEQHPGARGTFDQSFWPTFYGFDVVRFLNLVGFQAIRNGLAVPATLWQNGQGCFDPIDMVLDPALREQAKTCKVFRALGIACPEEYQTHLLAQQDALFCTELCAKLGFLGCSYDDDLRARLLLEASKLPEVVAEEPVTEEVPADSDAEYAESVPAAVAG